MSDTQPRDDAGRFGTVTNTLPELELSPAPADIEGLRATLVDFLEGSLPGFGFNVYGVDKYVDVLVDSLIDSHIDE